MLAPNSSALGPPGAKRGGGSSLASDASCFGVAGDAQATTHTSRPSVHTRGRATLLSSERPPAPWLNGDLRARCLAIACLPYRLPRRPLRRVPGRRLQRLVGPQESLRTDRVTAGRQTSGLGTYRP